MMASLSSALSRPCSTPIDNPARAGCSSSASARRRRFLGSAAAVPQPPGRTSAVIVGHDLVAQVGPVGDAHDGAVTGAVIADPRADDVGLATGPDLLGHPLPGVGHPPRPLLRHDVGGDRRPPGRQFSRVEVLEVAEHRHRHGARDRRRRHHQDVRRHDSLAA